MHLCDCGQSFLTSPVVSPRRVAFRFGDVIKISTTAIIINMRMLIKLLWPINLTCHNFICTLSSSIAASNGRQGLGVAVPVILRHLAYIRCKNIMR